MKTKIAKCIATGCYTGFSPIAPGTIASLVLMIAFMVISLIIGERSQLVLFFLTFIITVSGWWAAGVIEKMYSIKDPSVIVIDEWAGMGISVMLFPFDASLKSWILYGIAFLLFRLFDIVKPFPINYLERLKGGSGIMLDDVAAGVFTLAMVLLIEGYFV